MTFRNFDNPKVVVNDNDRIFYARRTRAIRNMNVNMFRRAAVVAIAVMVSRGASLYMTAGGGGAVHTD